MIYRVEFSRQAQKDLAKLDAKLQVRVANTVDLLATNPYMGKKLTGELRGLFSCRVWPFRIIYEIENNIIQVNILKIKHRKDVYR